MCVCVGLNLLVSDLLHAVPEGGQLEISKSFPHNPQNASTIFRQNGARGLFTRQKPYHQRGASRIKEDRYNRRYLSSSVQQRLSHQCRG